MLSPKVQRALNLLVTGKPIILVDDYYRENEGDIVLSAEKVTKESLIWTLYNARGLLCMPSMGKYLDRLLIPAMVANNTDKNKTPFSVSIDARYGTTTGMSVQDRLKTIEIFLDPTSAPTDLTRPGHMFPLRARAGLLNDRQGHTEGSIELMLLAKLKGVSLICEIMNPNGTMMKGSQLDEFSMIHNVPILSMEEVYDATYN